jgi:thymidylate synthase (FAD)
MKVTLKQISPAAELNTCWIARVSNPGNQDNPEFEKLLRYCVQHQHWSVFEHAHMTLEIETSLAVATQILRHRSFTFQQWSQRYSDPTELGFEEIELRKQGKKNRQGSEGELEPEVAAEFLAQWEGLKVLIEDLYTRMLEAGVAKECARFILPQSTKTKLYMTGNIRSWIHYIQLRTEPTTQFEHYLVAKAAQEIFVRELPVISAALGWREDHED